MLLRCLFSRNRLLESIKANQVNSRHGEHSFSVGMPDVCHHFGTGCGSCRNIFPIFSPSGYCQDSSRIGVQH